MVNAPEMQRVIADTLMRLRYEHKLSAKEVADKADLNVSTVFNYEYNNVQSMKIDTLGKIIEVYGIPLDIFFNSISAKMQKEG